MSPGAHPAHLRPVHVGCSGWNYRSWRGVFYPEGMPARRWLEHYATVFGTVEVNATFYRLPSIEAVEHWVEQTPPGFLFAVKASRYITHVKRLTRVAEGVEHLYARIRPLIDAGRLGPVLWQLPGTLHRDDDRLTAALAALPEGRHCFEFRHESWFAPAVYDLLRSHDAALVIGDHPDRPFQAQELTASWSYLRFHYGRRGRDGNYSATELDAWCRRIKRWRREAEIFAYFNNDWSAFAPRDALALAQLLGEG